MLPVRQVFFQPVKILLIGPGNEFLKFGIERFSEERFPSQPGSAVFFFESHGHSKDRHCFALKHKTLWYFYLHKPAAVFIILPVRSVHCKPVLSSHAQIQFMDGIGESVRTPPMLHFFRITKGIKYCLAGKTENSCA